MGSGVTGSRAPRRHAQLRSASISTKGLIITKKKRHRPSSRLPENFLKGKKKKKSASMLQWFAGSEQPRPAQGRGGEPCCCPLLSIPAIISSRTKHGEVFPLAQLPSLCSPTHCSWHFQQRHNIRRVVNLNHFC